MAGTTQIAMPSCLVLGDPVVQGLLENLTRQDIIQWQQELKQALKRFSTSDERELQPEPSVINRSTGQRTLFRPFTSPDSVGIKIVVDPAPAEDKEGRLRRPPLHGILTICDNQGIPKGLINAEAVTGFRTALSALIPLLWRERVGEALIFGAGTQALWHIRHLLALRGDDVASIAIVNRSTSRSQALADQIAAENNSRWHSKVQLEVVDVSSDDGRTTLRKRLSTADLICCTVPSEEPLFKADDVLSGRTSMPLITAVGSWQASMIELDPALLKHAASRGEDTGLSGRVIADDVPSCLENAGEIVQSGLRQEQLVEIGSLVETEHDESTAEWLRAGLVIYKSIGVSLTDLVVGNSILKRASEAELGVLVSDF